MRVWKVPGATETLIEEYSEDLEDLDVAPDFWLSLAATQWKMGRLEEGVKARALELIDSRADLRRWKELGGSASDLRERSRALARLRARLTSPQRAPVRIRTPPRETSPFEQGDLFSYRLTSGPTVLFRVIELFADRGGTTPVIGLLDWAGKSPPRGEATLSTLPLKRRRSRGEADSATYLVFGGGTKRYPGDRIEILVRGLPAIEGGLDDLVLDWEEVDEEIEKRVGLREDPTDTPFNYSIEYSARTAAAKAVEELRARGVHAEVEGEDAGVWFVGVQSDADDAEAERELQGYADRTNGRLYLP